LTKAVTGTMVASSVDGEVVGGSGGDREGGGGDREGGDDEVGNPGRTVVESRRRFSGEVGGGS